MNEPRRLKNMRQSMIAVALGLILGACGVDDPEVNPLPTTTTTHDRPVATTTTTIELGAYECGEAFPVFPAELDPGDLWNVSGTAGPGPGSYPAADRQIVAHWEGDEYATAYELRWPAEPHDYQFEMAQMVADLPATWPELVDGRAVAYIEVAPERSDPCRLLAVETYGSRSEPLLDSIFTMTDRLRPASELDDYLADIADRTTQAEDPDGRPPGECATPVAATVDEWGHVEHPPAADLVARYIADRVAGDRATDCLTESALTQYPHPGSDWHEPPLCLFDCEDGSILVGAQVETVYGLSGLFEYRQADGSIRRMRERYRVESVPTDSGESRAMIVFVSAEPESYVQEGEARRVISGFLDALAVEEWEVAWGYLVDEGAGEELFEIWDDPWETDPNEALPRFCRTALCDSRYEILETVQTDSFGRTLNVRFYGAGGPIDKAIGVGMFEGHISVSNLPPEGRDGDSAPTLATQLFGDQTHGPLAVFRYDVAELIEPDAPSEYKQFWPSRYLRLPSVAGDWVVYDDGWGYVYAVHILGGERVLVSDGDDVSAAGVARMGQSTYAFFTDYERLHAYDVVSGDSSSLVDRSGAETLIYHASVAGDLLVVTLGFGDSIWFEVFDLTTPSGNLHADFDRKLSPKGAAGPAHPSPYGVRLAYVVEEELHHPTIVAVSDLNGNELGRWMVPTGRVVGPITYDGRWIIGELWETLGGGDPGERLVIDTTTGTQHIVESYDLLRFR